MHRFPHRQESCIVKALVHPEINMSTIVHVKDFLLRIPYRISRYSVETDVISVSTVGAQYLLGVLIWCVLSIPEVPAGDYMFSCPVHSLALNYKKLLAGSDQA